MPIIMDEGTRRLDAAAQSVLDAPRPVAGPNNNNNNNNSTHIGDIDAFIDEALAESTDGIDALIDGAIGAPSQHPTAIPDPDVAYGDYADATQAGVADLASGVGGLVSMAGAKDLGQSVTDYWSQAAENQVAQMSPEGQKQMGRSFIGEGGIATNAGADNTGDAFMLKLARTAPSLIAGLVPGGLALRAGAGVRATMLAGAAGESAIGAGFAASDIGKAIDGLSEQQLETTFAKEWGAALSEYNGDKRRARAALKQTAQRLGGAVSGVLSAATGALGGAALAHTLRATGVAPAAAAAIKAASPTNKFAKAAALGVAPATTRRGAAAKSFLPGTLQEGLQESGEQLGVNVGTNSPLGTDLLEAGVGGALMGGPMESAMAGAMGPRTVDGGVPVDPGGINPTPFDPQVPGQEGVSPDPMGAPMPDTAEEGVPVMAIGPTAFSPLDQVGEDIPVVPAVDEAPAAPPTSVAPTAFDPLGQVGEDIPIVDEAPAGPTNLLDDSSETAPASSARKKMGDLLDRVQVTLGGSKTKSAATKAIYTEVLRGIQDAKKKVLAGDWGPARDLIMKASESKAVLNKHRDGVVAALAANDADAMLTAIEGMAGRLTSTREKQSTPPSPDPDRPAPTNVVEELQQGMDHWELVETTPRINTATGKPAKVAHWTNAERQVPAQAVISVLRNASKHFAPEFSNRVAEILVKYGGATGLNTRAKLAGAYEEVTALMAEASGSMTTAPTVAPPVTVVGDEYVAQTPEPLKEEKAPTKGRKKVTLKPKTKTKAEPAPLPNVNIPYTSDAGYDALVNFQASIKGTKGRITTALKDFYEGHPWPAQDIRVSLAIVGDRLGKELTSKADVVEILEAFRQQQLEAKVIEQRAEKKRKAKLTKATAAVATDKPTGTQVREATEEVFDEDRLSDITDVLAEQEGEAGSNTSAAGVAEDQMTFTAGPQSADWAAELRVAKEQGTEDVKAALEEIDAFEKQGREDINAGDDHQSLKALARTDLKDEANRRRKQAVRGGGEYSESADEQIGDSFADPDANQPDQMDYDDGYESRKDKGDTDPLDRPISDEARRAFLDKNYIGQASELFHRIMRKGRGKGTLPIVFADKMASLIRSGKGEQGVAIDTVLEGFVTAFGKSHPWGQLANRMRRMDFGNASVTMSQRMPVVGDRTLMGLVNPSIVLSAVPNADGDYVDGSVSTASDVLITDTGLYHADAPAADTGNKGEFLHTILHEIIHLATLQTIREGGPGVAELEAIYLELTQMASDADIDAQYGFTNFAEFVAEAFSNPDFQKHLSKIPIAPKKGKIASAWDAILTAIRKIIGARSVPNSALDEVMRVGAPMFDKGWATRRTVHAEGDLLPLARDMSMEERPYERMPATQAEAARIVDSSPRIGVLRRNGEATSLVDFVGDEGDFSIFHPASGTYMNRKGPVNRAAKRAVEKSETARKVARVVSASKTGQLFTHSFNDIVDRFKGRFVVDGVSLLEKYRDSKEKQQAIVTTHRAAIDKIFQRVRAMGSSADRFDLAKLLKASTMERIDIAESWGSDTNKHWREHKSARIAAKKKALHEEMRRELGSLGKGREAIQHYRDLRDYFIQADADQKRFTVERLLKSDAKELGLRKVEGSQEFFDHEKITALAVELEGAKNKAAVSEIINRHVIDPEFKGVDKLATALRPILLTRRRAGPYFPLRRYGQYVVHAQRVTRSGFNTSEQAKEFAALINANAHSQYSEFSKAVVATKKAGDVNSPYIVEVTEQHTEFARSELEAEVAADKLRAAGDFTEPKVTTKNSFLQGVGNIAGASALAERLKAGVSDSGLKNTIDHTVMQMMELTAARQAQLTRESVAGASDDMYRAIADQAEAHAWIMSDMATVAEQQEMLSRMRDVGKEAGTKGGLTEVVNHLNTRDQQGLDKDRLSNHLDDLSSQAGYYLHLASISYSIVNLTQQILVGLPWLHKKYGFVQGTKLFMANSAMGARAAGSEVRRTRMGMLTPDQYMEQIDKIVTGKGQTGKATALRHLVDTGLISATFIQELHNTKAGGITAGTGKDMLRKATNWTRNLPQLVEQYNRMTMAGAGYDGAIAKGMSHEQAVEMARKAVVETQFDYSGMNRPALFKMGPAPRTLFMFKMYAQGMYSLFVRESVGAMTSADPAAKKEALRFWVSFMGVNTIASGVLGGMMIEPLRAVASTIAAALGDEDDGIDWETEAKTMAFEWAQEQGMDHSTAAKFADALAYGITRGGDALPDFSNRVGLRNLLLMSTTNKSGTPEEAMQNAFVGVFGPMGDYVVKRLPKAYSKIRDGRAYEGVEAAMPKGVRDLMKAARRLQGGQKSASSTETLPPMTVAEAVTQGVGFTTAKDARTYDAMGARYGYETAMKNRRQNLMYRLYRASGAERDRLFDTDITAWNNGPGQFDRNLRIHRKDMYKGLQDLRKRQRKVKGGTSPRLKSTDKAVPFSE